MAPRSTHSPVRAAIAPFLAAVVAASVTACASESPTAITSTTIDGAPAAETTDTTEPTEDLVVIEVEVRDGDVVSGGGRVEIELGSTVELRVSSDADDELHLHGYDEVVAIVAGEVSVLRFDAELPGVFEAELHESGTVVVELAVS